MSAARAARCSPSPRFEQTPSIQTGMSASSREPLFVDAERVEQLLVPAARRQVEEAGARGDRGARDRSAAEVVGERDEALRLPEDVGLRLREPRELRRPERRMQVGAGAGVDGIVVEPATEPLGGVRAPSVAPAEELGQRLSVAVERDEAVAEARDAVRFGAVEHLAAESDDLVGVAAVVALLPQLVDRLALLVEPLRPHGGRADVEREHGRHAANLPW